MPEPEDDSLIDEEALEAMLKWLDTDEGKAQCLEDIRRAEAFAGMLRPRLPDDWRSWRVDF